MGKVIFWLVVVFAVLFVLRLLNAGKARAREAARRTARDAAAAPMVRCVSCGVFLPKADAFPAPQGFHCGKPGCAQDRSRGG